MKYLKIYIILFSGLFSMSFVRAQEHGHDSHAHLRNEIGFSGGPLYSFEHKEWGAGIHLHYFRTLGVHSKWSLGAGFEHAWVDGNHVNVSAGIKYQLLERMSIAALPGVTFLSHKSDTQGMGMHEAHKPLFTLHFECVYDIFYWENFHLGPVFDYSWTKKDSHAMLGIHVAFCF